MSQSNVPGDPAGPVEPNPDVPDGDEDDKERDK